MEKVSKKHSDSLLCLSCFFTINYANLDKMLIDGLRSVSYSFGLFLCLIFFSQPKQMYKKKIIIPIRAGSHWCLVVAGSLVVADSNSLELRYY